MLVHVEVGRNTRIVVEEISNIKGYRVTNKINSNYRNVIIRGSISLVYIRILKGECKMSNVELLKQKKGTR